MLNCVQLILKLLTVLVQLIIFSVFILDICAKKFNSSQASIAHLNDFTSQSPFNRPAAISHKTEKYFLRQNLQILFAKIVQ